MARLSIITLWFHCRGAVVSHSKHCWRGLGGGNSKAWQSKQAECLHA